VQSETAKEMIFGYEYPMRNQNDTELGPALGAALSICAEVYCGIKENTLNQNILIECSKFVYKYYKDLGLLEIREAFEMCANNKFEKVNMKAFYGQFNVSMLGDILSAYKSDRNKVLNKILYEHERAISGESFMDIVEHKNYVARQEVIAEFKAEIEKKRNGKELKYKTVDEIRIHWPRILIDKGIIELPESRKRELWNEAKDLVMKKLRMTATNYDDIYEAKGARQMIKNIETNGQKTIREKAEVFMANYTFGNF
jgi:hypothetical protein